MTMGIQGGRSLDVLSEQYLALRNALVSIQDDASAVLSVLSAQSDNGARFIHAAYTELRRTLVRGRLTEAETVGQLISVVLRVQDGGADDELAENKIHEESLKWLLDGIGAILARDNSAGIKHLENLTDAVYCNESLQWVAWLWMARAAANAGDLDNAHEAARAAYQLSDQLDAQAVSTSLCRLGEIEQLQANYDASLKHLSAASRIFEKLRDSRGLATAWLGRARAHVGAGRPELAADAATKAADADPDWAQPPIFIARLAVVAGDLDKAGRVLEPMARREPRPAEVERELRLLRLARDGVIEASLLGRYLQLVDQMPSTDLVDELGQLVAQNPRFLQLRELLAWNLAKLGRDDEAGAHFDQLATKELDADLHSSVLLGLGCLANRRNHHRQPGARVRAAAAASFVSAEVEIITSPEFEAEAVAEEKEGGFGFDFESSAGELSETAVGTRPELEAAPASPTPAPESGELQQAEEAGAKAVFTGDLQLFAVPDLLEFLKSSRRTGTLVVTSEFGIGAVHMRQGMLTGAAAPGSENLGEMLIEAAVVTADQIEAHRKHDDDRGSKLIGRRLVDAGLVDRDTVKKVLVDQVYAAVHEMVGWTTGRFAFEPDKRSGADAPDSSEIDIELDSQAVLLDVLRRIDEENR